MQDRVLPLSGIHNFRDYGGYAARGGTLRSGRLWRSGQHDGATPTDLAMVHDLGIGVVIDLRGDSERALHPCLRHGAFSGEVLFHPGETASVGGRAVHEEMADRVQSAQDARHVMTQLYRRLPFRPVLVDTYRLYLQALAERDAVTLLHCLAGKDRTGFGVALVHALLGVHPDDMLDDYLLTNTAGNPLARLASLRAHMGGTGMRDDALQVLMAVEPGFLDASFTAIRERHGSVEAYAAEVLGADRQTIAAMERRLIV